MCSCKLCQEMPWRGRHLAAIKGGFVEEELFEVGCQDFTEEDVKGKV